MSESIIESTALKSLRVGIVEDDPTLRLFMQKLIQKPDHHFELAGAWESAEAAVKPLIDSRPHVVVVDLELPTVSGMELIRQLSPRLIETAFVVLTIHDNPDKVFDALRAGANGYLLKSAKPSEIAAGIRQASEGGAPLSQNIARLLIKSFQAPAVPQKKDIPCLTPRESQMIERLAQGMVPKKLPMTWASATKPCGNTSSPCTPNSTSAPAQKPCSSIWSIRRSFSVVFGFFR